MLGLLIIAGGVLAVVWIFSIAAAYRNGVNEGFGYACEPWNPEYQQAGAILANGALKRWQQKKPDPDDFVCSDCQHDCSSDCHCWCHGTNHDHPEDCHNA